jgi:LysM repeat protein
MNRKIITILMVTFLLLNCSTLHQAHAQEIIAQGVTISYKVMYGDNLWGISQKFDTTIKEILRINNLSSAAIASGQILSIYTGPRISVAYYTVQPRDTLWDISSRMGVSINNLMAVNGLNDNMLNIGQILTVCYKNPVDTVNYRVAIGETVWGIAKKYGTSIDTILKSNYMNVDYLMPGEILTIPVNSIQVVKPTGIMLMKPKETNYYGDIYTWDNGRRLFTVGTDAVAKDAASGISWKIRYYGGSNHADIVTLTKEDTDIMYKVFGSKWSWINKRQIIIFFSQGGTAYQIACSLIGQPHSTTNILDNGMVGHCCLYFYDSIGHSDPNIDPIAQSNVLMANGQLQQ